MLSEVLVVVLVGVPFSEVETYIADLVSIYLSIGILSVMIITLIVVVIRRKRLSLVIPRTPDTLGAVMSYLCASHMLLGFQALEGMDEKERRETIVGWGKRYRYGKMAGTDGVTRWMIDDCP